jgi:hypothetical protein
LTVQAPISPSVPTVASLTGVTLQQRLRQQRSRTYIEAIKRLDAGTHQQNKAALDDLIKAIGEEFPELTNDQRPLGIVSRCYLGAPYVVHICDLSGNIIEHFESYRSMPPLFERARLLAMHSAYLFIEVYPDTLRAVSPEGAVSVIEK